MLALIISSSFLVVSAAVFFKFLKADGDFTLLSKGKVKREEIEDKVIWITGASRGIGEVLAKQLASLGAKLIISARNEVELQRVKEQLTGKHAPDEVVILPLDLSRGEEHLAEAVQKAESLFGGAGVDYVFHNAAYERPKSLALDVSEESLKATFDVNVLGPLSLTRLVAPHMLKRGRGHFVVMSSAAGKAPAPGQAVYSASKFAVNGYFHTLRSELCRKGIKVTIVCPGPVTTSTSSGSSEKRVSSERCAELTIIAASHGLKEAWISYQPVLAVMYLVQYMPTVGYWLMDKIGEKSTVTAKSSSSLTVKCSLTVPTASTKAKIKEKLNGNSLHPAPDIPSNLCLIDTLERLGIDRYFQSQIHTILDDTYRLWELKDRDIFSDITTHAMAFRLLRVKGYQVSSEELAPYADQELVNVQTVDVPTIIELYRAAQERIYEEESTLEKLLAWTSTFLKQQLQTNSIPNKKLHKNVEYYLKNYHGILDRMGVRRSLDVYDINYYKTLEGADSLCNEDLVAFARQDFNVCQAQHQKELEELQRWYVECRLDTLKHGRKAVNAANFLTSAIIGDPELSHARLAFAKHIVLVACIDDFFDHGGSREEPYKILELVKEWREKPAAEYGSEEVEILFTAVYNTVNELAEMAHVEQGRSVKDLMIKTWVEILSVFKLEDTWSNETSLDEYLSSSWVSAGCRICILTSMQFLGIKLSQEKLLSEECIDLCWHVSMIDRLLNDVGGFEKECKESRKVNSVSLLMATHDKDGRAISKEEAILKVKEMAEYHRRKLMQIVYRRGTIMPRQCKDMFLKVCRIGCYLYSSGDEFTSPQQMMEDVKSLVYKPVTLDSPVN